MLFKSFLIVSAITPIICSAYLSQESFLEATFSREEDSRYRPVRENAHYIFNAIHGAMRQWGSSLKHNGMSFFPATIPNKTLFYHGRHDSRPITGMGKVDLYTKSLFSPTRTPVHGAVLIAKTQGQNSINCLCNDS
jgi:hypothetical protein